MPCLTFDPPPHSGPGDGLTYKRKHTIIPCHQLVPHFSHLSLMLPVGFLNSSGQANIPEGCSRSAVGDRSARYVYIPSGFRKDDARIWGKAPLGRV